MGQEEVSSEINVNKTFNDLPCKSRSHSNPDLVRGKVEAMQRRINELKEKVKYEGDCLKNEECSFKSSVLEDDITDCFGDSQTASSNSQGKASLSDQSLYFSASSFSLCSLSSSSSDCTAHSNFSRFVSSFVRTQEPKERLSLLQLHSNKQISLNMMRGSLMELESRCSAELQLVERSLQHLQKLAKELEIETVVEEDSYPRALEFTGKEKTDQRHSKNDTKRQSFPWPPLKSANKLQIDWSNNPAFQKISDGNSD